MTPTPESLKGSALDEETARAELYGLLALLFYAPPTTELMTKLRVAVTDTPAAGAFLEEPWRALVGVAREMTDQDIQSEYDSLFGGIGKPEVYLYASHFLSGFLNEKPLVRLRTELASLGLARDDGMSETEDHMAYLCEVMRYLIAGEDVTVANLTRQREFFSNHLQPWVTLLCDDLQTHPKARFYSALAELTRAFMGVEAQGFDMLT
ncbi:MAG: molecular chaperone TorD family protein [Comamonadaceae bacterium]